MAVVAGDTPADQHAASTLDALKFAAVVLMFADHIGLYFMDGNAWRVAGRPVAIIFGYLIGFAGPRRVPASWIALGLGLTLMRDHLEPGGSDRTLDILITLALTRIMVPFFDAVHAHNPLLLIPLAIVLALSAEATQSYLEYSTEIAVVALIGVARRLHGGRAEDNTALEATGLIALVGITLIAIRHLEFTTAESLAAAALIALTIYLLTRFSVAPVTSLPPGPAALMRFAGRNTLAIYVVHMALFLIGAHAIEKLDPD